MASPTLGINVFGLNLTDYLGLDSSGKTDVGPALNSFFLTYAAVGAGLPALQLAAGKYLINTPVEINATSSTYGNIVIVGDGRATYGGGGTVQFLCNTPGQTAFWINNSQPSAGNEKGPRLEHLSFVDVTPQKNVAAALRITQMNNIALDDLSFANFAGSRYSVGTITVTNGQAAFTGRGAAFSGDMQFGHLQINGKVQEIAQISSATAGQLTSKWQFPSGTYSYLIAYGGVGLMLEGTSAAGFTQYGRATDLLGFNNRCWIQCVGAPTSVAGVSRIALTGRNNGNRVPDSIGVWLGKFTDTMDVAVSQNNVAFGIVIESSHANRISSQIENNGAYTVVSTVNNGIAAQQYTRGVVLNSDDLSCAKDNIIVNGYYYSVGTAIDMQSANVVQTQIGFNRLRGNMNNYGWADGSVGLPAGVVISPPLTTAVIVQADYQGLKP